MSIAYSAEVGNYTLFLDSDGTCVRVDVPSDRPAEPNDDGVLGPEARYLGAQFVAALDVTVPGGLLPLPQVGAQLLLGRVLQGRISLLRTRAVTEFVDYTLPGHAAVPPPPSARSLSSLPARLGPPPVAVAPLDTVPAAPPSGSRLPPLRLPGQDRGSSTQLPPSSASRTVAADRPSVPPNPYAPTTPSTMPPPPTEIRHSEPGDDRTSPPKPPAEPLPPGRGTAPPVPRAVDPMRSQVFSLAQLASREPRPLPTAPPHKRPTLIPRAPKPPTEK